MSAYPETLLSHLDREVTTVCHCWRLTRKDGEVTGYTDHDRPLTIGATLFAPESGLSASEARDTLGLAVDTVDVEGALSSDAIRDEDIAAGLYDGASVDTFLVNWQPTDFVLLRTATIGKITRSDQWFAGGDLALSWVRRGRIDADSWTPSEIPLGEEREEYRIEIAHAGGAVVRTETVPTAGFVYGSVVIAADFGSPPAEIDVTVRQLSIAAGWGIPATRRFALS